MKHDAWKTSSSFLQGTEMPSAMIRVILDPLSGGEGWFSSPDVLCLLHMVLCQTAVKPVVDPWSCCTGRGQENLSFSEQCSQDVVDGKASPCYKTGEDEWLSTQQWVLGLTWAWSLWIDTRGHWLRSQVLQKCLGHWVCPSFPNIHWSFFSSQHSPLAVRNPLPAVPVGRCVPTSITGRIRTLQLMPGYVSMSTGYLNPNVNECFWSYEEAGK